MKEKIITACENGNFIEVLDKIYMDNRNDSESLYETLISLQNNNELDVLVELQKVKNDLEDINFYSVQQTFQEILPKLEVSVDQVISCIDHFVKEGQSTGLIFNSFTKYCEADDKRPSEVLGIEFNDESLDFVYSAIIAGGRKEPIEYSNIAIGLSQKGSNQRRHKIIIAIGNLDFKNNKKQMHKVFKSLSDITQKKFDDHIFSAVLRSCVYLYLQDNTLEERLITLAKTIIAKGTDEINYTISNIFEVKELPEIVLDLFLVALESTNVENRNILGNISYGLVKLLKTDRQEKAFKLLDTLLLKNKEKLKLNDFGQLYHEMSGNEDVRNKEITRWLLSRKIPLCEAAFTLIQESYKEDIELKIDTSSIPAHPKLDYVFLSRKAIGWFSMKPVSSLSFIVSFLKEVDDDGEESEQILSVVFEFLLINYSGKVKRYIERVIKDQPVKVQGMLQQLLNDFKLYSIGLDEAWDLQELSPSQSHREIHSRYYNKLMSEAFKEADKKSSLSQIFSKIILLYGNQSIHYMRDLESSEEPKRVVTPMHSNETSVEFPRLTNIDPHNYDYWMRVFRVEGCS